MKDTSSPFGRPFRLTTLGTLDFRDPDGDPVDAVLGSPKRMALLLYLACHGANRFVARDHLLALLWPEFDDERARNSLRTTLYSVRSALGPGVIAASPDGSLGIERDALHCDAVAFDRAMEGERWAEAVALYSGDFLDGRPVLELAEFAGWIEMERARLRRRAVQALWGLSESRESEGDLADAISLGRRALALAPANEITLRRLVSLQYRSGDRSGALDTYESFEDVLRGRFEVDPSEETKGLIERIRAGEAPSPGSVAPARTGPIGSLPAQPASSIRAWSVSIDAPEEADPPTAAVLAFEYAGDSGSQYLAQAVRYALVGSLDHKGFRAGVENGSNGAGRKDDPSLALQGLVVSTAGRVRITGTATRNGGPRKVRATVDGPSSRLLEMVDALTDMVLEDTESE